jgi:hypothetical protein
VFNKSQVAALAVLMFVSSYTLRAAPDAFETLFYVGPILLGIWCTFVISGPIVARGGTALIRLPIVFVVSAIAGWLVFALGAVLGV